MSPIIGVHQYLHFGFDYDGFLNTIRNGHEYGSDAIVCDANPE